MGNCRWTVNHAPISIIGKQIRLFASARIAAKWLTSRLQPSSAAAKHMPKRGWTETSTASIAASSSSSSLLSIEDVERWLMTNEVPHEAIGIERTSAGDGFGVSNEPTLVSLVDLLDQWSPLGWFHVPEMRFDSGKPTRLESLQFAEW